MALKHTRVAVTADDASSDVKISDWNADHVVDTDGLKIVADATVPAAPAAGHVQLFGADIAGGLLPAYRSPLGLPSALQPLFGQRKIALLSPAPNTSIGTGTFFGFGGLSVTGTATTRTVATTRFFTMMSRIGYVSAATVNSRGGGNVTTPMYCRGDAAGIGGFRAVFRFGASDAAAVATANTFVGMVAASSILNGGTEPSAATNIIGIGAESTDANLSIYTNDGTGTATKIALGTSFPASTLSTDAYELVLYAAPNAASIGYQVTRLNTGAVATGSVTSDLPVATQLIFPIFMRGNMGTALAVGMDVMGLYVETEN